MSRILLAGNDSKLLATRGAVLAQTHANVTCCIALEALDVLDRESFDLVVLCHSLTPSQAAAITECVHQRQPKISVLLVASGVAPELLSSGIPFDATCSTEPDRLVARTSELLSSHPNRPVERPGRPASGLSPR